MSAAGKPLYQWIRGKGSGIVGAVIVLGSYVLSSTAGHTMAALFFLLSILVAVAVYLVSKKRHFHARGFARPEVRSQASLDVPRAFVYVFLLAVAGSVLLLVHFYSNARDEELWRNGMVIEGTLVGQTVSEDNEKDPVSSKLRIVRHYSAIVEYRLGDRVRRLTAQTRSTSPYLNGGKVAVVYLPGHEDDAMLRAEVDSAVANPRGMAFYASMAFFAAAILLGCLFWWMARAS